MDGVEVGTVARPLAALPLPEGEERRPSARGEGAYRGEGGPCTTGEAWDNGILAYKDIEYTLSTLPHTFWTGSSMLFLHQDARYGARYDVALDAWSEFSMVDGPGDRDDFSVVWTGSELIVWGGWISGVGAVNTGSRYDPVLDSWTPTSDVGAPPERRSHTAVWAGDRMIVYGGRSLANAQMKSGYESDPLDDSWTASAFNPVGEGRWDHVAAWTGDKMVVWGGVTAGERVNTGAHYDPVARSWGVTDTAGAPVPRSDATAVALGGEMIVWGGLSSDSTQLGDGARYDPASDDWTPVATNGPTPRYRHDALATDSEMVLWGGISGSGFPLDYFRYDPVADSWTPINGEGAPTGPITHLVWSGDELLAWDSDVGARYDLEMDSWSPMGGVPNAPFGRSRAFSVWTGNEMIVWGGSFDPGGRYDPLLDAWSAVSTIDEPTSVSEISLVWTGDEMIVWGGTDASNEGGRYDPVSDSWTPTSLVNAPQPRHDHSAVWTGDEMIVWGGRGLAAVPLLNDGGRYVPATDSWIPLSTVGAPEARRGHRAVWTGREMIVWGGFDTPNGNYLSSGGRYDPTTDGWSPTSSVDAPEGRSNFTALWTGNEMIVWGGTLFELGPGWVNLQSGGRYDPTADTWSPTSLIDAPTARELHGAVWTGAEMLIWGGLPEDPGGRYDPTADSWAPFGSPGEPNLRYGLSAVWTGEATIVWGGEGLDSGGLYRIGDIDGDGVCNADDNCATATNLFQQDQDADVVGDACDNCASTPNADQADGDLDGSGDVCDVCPLDRDDDADGDGLCADVDVCPGDAANDLDGDGQCGDVDCDPVDPNDRTPPSIVDLRGAKPAPETIELSWTAVPGADSYAVTRGDLSGLDFGQYGSCVAEGLVEPSYSDPDPAGSGQVQTYLAQAANDDCGLGELGPDFTGRDRSVWSGQVCSDPSLSDVAAVDEITVFGEHQGDLADTEVSDDLAESITEEITAGPPSSRISRLEHRWTFQVPGGNRIELHVEGFRTDLLDGDAFAFEYSTDGGTSWNPITLTLPLSDDDIDLVATLPSSLSGGVIVRVVDTNRDPGNAEADTLSVDQLFVRSVP
jgi:N-acetylneuraminic acid mutarotase